MPDPVLFVPGLLCTAALFAPQVEALSARTACIVADHSRHDSMEKIVSSILDDAPARFSLVGLSMGGYIALEMAAHAPDRISSLVLMDTSSRPEEPRQTAFRREVIDLAETRGIVAAVDRLLPLFVDGSRLDDADLVAIVKKMAIDTGVETFKRQQTAIIGRKDARPDLPAIRSPTLVIVGDRDTLTPPELSEEIAAGIPGARLEQIPDSGHLTTLERPEAVNALLLDFFGFD